MRMRAFAIVVAALVLAASVTAQLPAVSWTCPMHPDVLDPKPGACSICGMDLEPIRLVLAYTCPVHAVIEQPAPGKCRICARDLVQKTAALTFTCAANREISQLEPGKCPDGTATLPKYTARAHGDHNAKHGGIFFMAPDTWHHLEGAYPAAGSFRVYVYDDFSKPLTLEQARKVRGRVVTKETIDPKTGRTRELASTPLVLARNGAFFEARVDAPLPAKLTAKIAFTSADKESRFDFAFSKVTRDVPAATTTMTAPNAPSAPNAPVAPVAPIAPIAPNSLLIELKARSAEAGTLLKTGNLGAVYVPALQAKDLALEIQLNQAGANQDRVEATVKQIVLAAYQLDNYGDVGDAEQAQHAFRSLSAAVSQLDSLLSERR